MANDRCALSGRLFLFSHTGKSTVHSLIDVGVYVTVDLPDLRHDFWQHWHHRNRGRWNLSAASTNANDTLRTHFLQRMTPWMTLWVVPRFYSVVIGKLDHDSTVWHRKSRVKFLVSSSGAHGDSVRCDSKRGSFPYSRAPVSENLLYFSHHFSACW